MRGHIERLVSTVAVLAIWITAVTCTARAQESNIPGGVALSADHISENVIELNNIGGTFSSMTNDCPIPCSVLGGWGNDVWELNLSQGADVRIEVKDCCMIGDAYEILLDCDASEAGAIVDPNHDDDSSIFHGVPGLDWQGTTVGLPEGTYSIRIHDDGGQCDAGCGAGYTVRIAVTNGMTAPLPVSIPRVDGLGPPYGGTLPCLDPTIVALELMEAKLDWIEIRLNDLPADPTQALEILEAKLNRLTDAVAQVITAQGQAAEQAASDRVALEEKLNQALDALRFLEAKLHLFIA
mgnify:CR=1 FL=1